MPYRDNPDLLEVLGSIYDWTASAADGDGGMSAAMALLGGTKAILFRLQEDGSTTEMLADAGFNQGVASAFIEARLNSGSLKAPEGSWLEDHIIDVAQVSFQLGESSVAEDDTVKPADFLHHCIVGVVDQREAETVLISLYRPVSNGPFTDVSRLLLSKMLPHWRRALKLKTGRADCDALSEALHRILDHTSYSILLVDSAANVLYQNDLAAFSSLADDGVSVRNGRLNFAAPEVAKQFQALLASQEGSAWQSKGSRGAMLRVDRSLGKQACQLLVWPTQIAPEAFASTGPIHAIFINDPLSAYPLDEDAVRVLGELTHAEARLCVSFYNTKNLSQSAKELGVTASTAKSHLLSIFRKLDINSQPELMGYLAHIPKIPA